MKAYIAAPMFSHAEKEFNMCVDAVVRSLGLDTYLPQRDGGEAARLVRQGMDEHTVRQRLFTLDCAAIAQCALFVFVLDGRVPDEGGCVELGRNITVRATAVLDTAVVDEVFGDAPRREIGPCLDARMLGSARNQTFWVAQHATIIHADHSTPTPSPHTAAARSRHGTGRCAYRARP